MSGCSIWIAWIPQQISSCSVEKCGRKWIKEVLLCADLVTPVKVKVTGKGIKWLKLTLHRSMAGMNKIWLKICVSYPSFKFLPHKMTGWQAGLTNMTDYMDPYVTHMDQKLKGKGPAFRFIKVIYFKFGINVVTSVLYKWILVSFCLA